ncbi:hypothetical protein PMAYCL1PPCAC_26999 [Pristionchus mayeri]|uniref:Uncharacterized protein n=1 Tax=Pristionchus mayeri TaxID=1317129 RepID=A0AAN5I9V0_9BILA|nr:hypothetical protein PMAYCL1PPCAC_26996 [Pristionchus mayeri]GMR56804.1 hypothetical protein PMAYCL1PPCAC_26999 [Pristionchus mayeri]
MSEDYRQFIADHQCKPGFVNNYFSAVLFLNLKDNHLTNAEFPIPLSVLEEELEREDLNLTLTLERATISQALKYFVIYLLRRCTSERVNTLNYESVLREVISREGALPTGLQNPLTPSVSFHCLPTVCKIFIIGVLRRLAGFLQKNLKAITSDSESNVFYAFPDGRVFVYRHISKRISP